MTTSRTTPSCFCRHHRLLQEQRRHPPPDRNTAERQHRRQQRSSRLVVTRSQKRDPKWGDGYQWGKNSLGKKSRWKSRLILEYEVAREFVWTLGLYDEDDWRDWAKDRRRGCVFIPRDPWNAYEGRGWIGTTKAFLGFIFLNFFLLVCFLTNRCFFYGVVSRFKTPRQG